MKTEYTLEEQIENRKKWVEALRSGKYEQASGVLFDGKAHCCLGVLCDVLGAKPKLLSKNSPDFEKLSKFASPGENIWVFPDCKPDNEIDSYSSEKWERYVTPYWAMKAVGLRTTTGAYSDDYDGDYMNVIELVDLNDQGKPFNVIADVIAEEPHGLFNNG